MFLRSLRIYKALVKSETRCYPTVKQEDRVQNEKSVSNAKKVSVKQGQQVVLKFAMDCVPPSKKCNQTLQPLFSLCYTTS